MNKNLILAKQLLACSRELAGTDRVDASRQLLVLAQELALAPAASPEENTYEPEYSKEEEEDGRSNTSCSTPYSG